MRVGDHCIDLVDPPHHFIHGAEPKFRHVLAHLLGNEEEEVDNMLRLPGEARAQHRILRGYAHRAGIQVALAHHDAAHADKRHGGKAVLFGAQQGSNHHIAAGLEFAIGLHPDAAAQIVEQQDLLRLGQAEFPRQAGMFDGTQRRSASTAAVAGDEHHICMGLGDACGHSANADLGNQLDRDAGLRVHILQIVDKLRQILDGINIVMRRRRDQPNTGNRVARLGDHLVHLVTG